MIAKLIALVAAAVVALGIPYASPVVHPASLPHATALSSEMPRAEAGGTQGVIVDVTRVPVPSELKYRGNQRAIVEFADQATIDRKCGTLEGSRVVACVSEIGVADMTLPNPCEQEFQGEDYAAVVCHEKGHTLGWHHEDPHVFGQREVH